MKSALRRHAVSWPRHVKRCVRFAVKGMCCCCLACLDPYPQLGNANPVPSWLLVVPIAASKHCLLGACTP